MSQSRIGVEKTTSAVGRHEGGLVSPKSNGIPPWGLQRTLGNQAMLRLFESGGLQAKLHISQPGDANEHRSDNLAAHSIQSSARKDSGVPGGSPSGLGSGRPLDSTIRGQMESGFGRDLKDVRIHTDDRAAQSARAVNALAYSVGRNVVFGRGQYKPETSEGRRLLGHELAHVVQQSKNGADSSGSGTPSTLEKEAWRAGDAIAASRRAAVSSCAAPGSIQCSTLSAALNAAWNARHDKSEIFDILRGATPAPGDKDAMSAIGTMFPSGTDDLWLASQIMLLGPEILWPPSAITARVTKATSAHWGPEAGNIGAALPDPGAAAGATPPTVEAFFFPGRSDRRALIISGVHGSEPQGVAVVQELRSLLSVRSKAGHPPFFTTILAPIIVPRTARSGSRTVPGVLGLDVSGHLTRHDADPNRNFPLPGEGLAGATARGKSSPTAPELQIFDKSAPGGVRAPHDTRIRGGNVSSIRMIPETRILIGLIERFQPERIASVHAHSLRNVIGDAPGIFVDPRGIDPQSGTVTSAAQGKEDDQLATAMVSEGRRRLAASPLPRTTGRHPKAPFEPFTGNAPAGSSSSTVHYSSTVHSEGSSLGSWAPVPVTGAGARAGITTMTVEVPEYDPATASRALAQVEDLDAHLLAEIFLEDPSVVTPASSPTTP